MEKSPIQELGYLYNSNKYGPSMFGKYETMKLSIWKKTLICVTHKKVPKYQVEPWEEVGGMSYMEKYHCPDRYIDEEDFCEYKFLWTPGTIIVYVAGSSDHMVIQKHIEEKFLLGVDRYFVFKSEIMDRYLSGQGYDQISRLCDSKKFYEKYRNILTHKINPAWKIIKAQNIPLIQQLIIQYLIIPYFLERCDPSSW